MRGGRSWSPDPGLIEAGWVDEAVAYLRQRGLRPAVWHDVTPNSDGAGPVLGAGPPRC